MLSIRTCIATATAILVLAVPVVGLQQKKPSDHGPIAWKTSMDAAKKTAAKQKKVMMVDYFAEWCPPCKEMLRTTYKDPTVVARSKRFVPVLIDIDKQPDETDQAKVESVPTVVFYDSSGKELLRAVGYQDAKAFLKLMTSAEQKAKK